MENKYKISDIKVGDIFLSEIEDQSIVFQVFEIDIDDEYLKNKVLSSDVVQYPAGSTLKCYIRSLRMEYATKI